MCGMVTHRTFPIFRHGHLQKIFVSARGIETSIYTPFERMLLFLHREYMGIVFSHTNYGN